MPPPRIVKLTRARALPNVGGHTLYFHSWPPPPKTCANWPSWSPDQRQSWPHEAARARSTSNPPIAAHRKGATKSGFFNTIGGERNLAR